MLFVWMCFLQSDLLDVLNDQSPITVNSAESLTAIMDHDAAIYTGSLLILPQAGTGA